MSGWVGKLPHGFRTRHASSFKGRWHAQRDGGIVACIYEVIMGMGLALLASLNLIIVYIVISSGA